MSEAGQIFWQPFQRKDRNTWPQKGRDVLICVKKQGSIEVQQAVFRKPGIFIIEEYYFVDYWRGEPRGIEIRHRRIDPVHYGNIVWAYLDLPTPDQWVADVECGWS